MKTCRFYSRVAQFTVTMAGLFMGAVVSAQTISTFTPHGGRGEVVTISGTGFTGATSVNFGGVAAASFTVDSDTQITATAPAAFTTGPINVNAGNSLFNFISRSGSIAAVGPVSSASLPLGVLASFTGMPSDGSISRAGGQTFFFQNMPLAANSWLYWGAGNGGVRLSMNGNDFNSPSGEVMMFSAAQSDLAAGRLVYTGNSQMNLIAPWPQGSAVCTRFTMQFQPYNSSPLVPLLIFPY